MRGAAKLLKLAKSNEPKEGEEKKTQEVEIKIACICCDNKPKVKTVQTPEGVLCLFCVQKLGFTEKFEFVKLKTMSREDILKGSNSIKSDEELNFKPTVIIGNKNKPYLKVDEEEKTFRGFRQDTFGGITSSCVYKIEDVTKIEVIDNGYSIKEPQFIHIKQTDIKNLSIKISLKDEKYVTIDFITSTMKTNSFAYKKAFKNFNKVYKYLINWNVEKTHT